jgi:fructose-1,6-bisphosphatase I
MATKTNGHGNGQDTAAGAVGTEVINYDIVTLTRFLTEEQVKHKEATGDFT